MHPGPGVIKTICVAGNFAFSTLCVMKKIVFLFFFFNDTATTEIYTLSLHDALPISPAGRGQWHDRIRLGYGGGTGTRSEEHTSELQSHSDLVCRLLLEKKKKKR